ncbi:MAG: GTP 3',8-cyclase MoaA, partial [Defluviitaleaceae bacterium]|nr:GTP 3',8-cyclase MoaA [Defluviitaleaceae bacterium]
SFGRTIDYARISITDRCNLRCTYCMPEGVEQITHAEVLRFEEILRLAGVMAGLGISRFKVTGGEPFVRSGAIDFIRRLKLLGGVSQVTLTTNGVLLERHLEDLADIGVDGVNISLDTLSRRSFRMLTGADELEAVLNAIDACAASGLRTKVNTVLLHGVNEHEVARIAELAREKVAAVRFIELMPVGRSLGEDAFGVAKLRRILESEFGTPEPIDEKLGNGPAVYYRVAGFEGKIGVIPAMSDSFCTNCNRIRLTSDGFLKLCLSHDDGIDLCAALRSGKHDADIARMIEQAVMVKPQLSGFEQAGKGRQMHAIGG